ncbi:MAG: ABC transporter ATP-binding protein [Chitinispirillales bacterium]|jgi:ABC-type multidrug transport system ATPase subunit|nr:ABC transporter ATP-binding protein [Chitinispirillales bacterium]
MIKANNISKKFGTKEILYNVSFEILPGEILGLVGLNGAGKTTLVRLLLGLINADKGTSQILGEIPTPKNSSILRKTGIVLENDGFNANLTFRENLNFFAKIKRVKKDDLQKYIDENCTELDAKKTPVKFFSKGERMQCAIARAFLGDPKAVILDEPTTGLDYEQCEKFFKIVTNSQKNGGAVIISSHNFFAVGRLCTKIVELKDAKISEISKNFLEEKRKYG